jgi:hypothetical protein
VLRAATAASDSTLFDMLHLAADLVLVSSTAVAVRAYARALPSGGSIIWLRRFRANRSRPFGRILERAALGVGHPVTLQDSRYSWSASRAMVRAGLLVPVILLIWLVGVFVLGLLVLEALHGDGPALAFLSAGWTLWLSWEVADRTKRAGHRSISSEQVRTILSGMQSGQGRSRLSPLLGVEVLSVRDEEWRDVVQAALRTAQAVVIDITEVTDPIREELVHALSTLGRDRLILAVERGPSADPERIWAEVIAPIQDVGAVRPTPSWVRTATFEYTAHPTYASAGFRRDVARLREMLVVATTQSD